MPANETWSQGQYQQVEPQHDLRTLAEASTAQFHQVHQEEARQMPPLPYPVLPDNRVSDQLLEQPNQTHADSNGGTQYQPAIDPRLDDNENVEKQQAGDGEREREQEDEALLKALGR